ncbi:hypothetical protein NQZ68_018223 [Dissostichus eleginoides]|nr:hypothetical protein NQZ68_018223 [Dissostichus eleginoides]
MGHPGRQQGHALETHRSLIGQSLPSWPWLSNHDSVRKTSGDPRNRTPITLCNAHGSGRGDHAIPSGPSSCAGGAACVTAVSASGTDTASASSE